MSIASEDLSPSQVAQLSGISVDKIRDWRRRGLIEELGSFAGNKWQYSLLDASVFACAAVLNQSGYSLDRCLLIARMMRQPVYARLGQRSISEIALNKRFWIFSFTSEKKTPDFWLVENLEEIPEVPSSSFIVVDNDQLTQELPKTFLSAYQSALQAEADHDSR